MFRSRPFNQRREKEESREGNWKDGAYQYYPPSPVESIPSATTDPYDSLWVVAAHSAKWRQGVRARDLTPMLLFKLGETTLSVKTREKYVGMHFCTDTQNMFEDHYKEKASTA
ncbi:hypothetical protein B0H12DRAFT_1303033 [Mycena haematopus]|nr:hypothetical protein B0H12DRAFT_1303033 [Mycena haematopus]